MNIEVDWPKYERARREEVLKGNYCKLEIVIPSTDSDTFSKEGNSPICHLAQHNSTVFDLTVLYKTLEMYMHNLENKYPGIKEFSDDTFGIRAMEDVEEENNDENI